MIRQVVASTAGGDIEPVRSFWLKIRNAGSPLVEPGSTPAHRLVTFVFEGDDGVVAVRLDSGINAALVRSVTDDYTTAGALSRVEGTSIWYLSVELADDLRAPYRFQVKRRGSDNATPVLDPLNRRVDAAGTQWARSVVELPNAPVQPWRSEVSRGQWRQMSVPSVALGGSRAVQVYLPPGYDANRTRPYAVLLAMDAYGYRLPLKPTDQIIEFLVRERRMPESVIILTEDVGPIGNTRGYDPVVSFLADEVLPFVRREIRISANPVDVVVTGTSRRGLIATYAAFRRPDAIGKVLSLSGSFYWRPPGADQYEWLAKLFAESDRRAVRLYLAAGKLETSLSDTNSGHYLLATNRHMRDVLTAKRYPFKYVEFMGVHSELNWEDQLAAGLAWLWSQ